MQILAKVGWRIAAMLSLSLLCSAALANPGATAWRPKDSAADANILLYSGGVFNFSPYYGAWVSADVATIYAAPGNYSLNLAVYSIASQGVQCNYCATRLDSSDFSGNCSTNVPSTGVGYQTLTMTATVETAGIYAFGADCLLGKANVSQTNSILGSTTTP